MILATERDREIEGHVRAERHKWRLEWNVLGLTHAGCRLVRHADTVALDGSGVTGVRDAVDQWVLGSGFSWVRRAGTRTGSLQVVVE